MGKKIFKLRIHVFSALLILLLTGLFSIVFTFSRAVGLFGIGAGSADSANGSNIRHEATMLTAAMLDSSDISRGSLILVNSENPFTIPNDADFVRLVETATPSYMIDRDYMLICRTVIDPLNQMMDAFYAESGLSNVTIRSSFRDHTRQQELLDERTALVGLTEALRWVAYPGHSEHHTGLAFDFGIFDNGTVRTFTGTGAYSWFQENSYRFGFILRYDEGTEAITGVAFEPWHYRYVGLPHSYFIRQDGLTLEEYIELIRGLGTNEVVRRYFSGAMYEIFHTRETELTFPIGTDFSISGDNIDGFIVTVRLPHESVE